MAAGRSPARPSPCEERFGTGGWRVLGRRRWPRTGAGPFRSGLAARSAPGPYRPARPVDESPPRASPVSSSRVTVTGAGRARRLATHRRDAHPAPHGGAPAGSATGSTSGGCRPPGLSDLREAMRRITQVSGIRFRYQGRTSVVPRRGYGGPGPNRMVVAWAPPERSGGLLFPGGSAVWVGRRQSGSRLVSGYVIMNTAVTTERRPRVRRGVDPGPGADARARSRRRPRPLAGPAADLVRQARRDRPRYGVPPTCAGCARSGRAATEAAPSAVKVRLSARSVSGTMRG